MMTKTEAVGVEESPGRGKEETVDASFRTAGLGGLAKCVQSASLFRAGEHHPSQSYTHFRSTGQQENFPTLALRGKDGW